MGILTEIKIKREKFLIFVVKIKCSVCGSENVSKNGTLKQRKKIYACKNDFYRNKPYNDAVSHQSDNWLYSHAAVKHYLCCIRTSADF